LWGQQLKYDFVEAYYEFGAGFAEYEQERVLGMGGFSKVILGVHRRTSQKVAIKMIHASHFGNAEQIDRLFQEA
jgi:serine/threonine protein kinase